VIFGYVGGGGVGFWGRNGVLRGKGKETFDRVVKRGTKL
jgi:hypothetical protein